MSGRVAGAGRRRQRGLRSAGGGLGAQRRNQWGLGQDLEERGLAGDLIQNSGQLDLPGPRVEHLADLDLRRVIKGMLEQPGLHNQHRAFIEHEDVVDAVERGHHVGLEGDGVMRQGAQRKTGEARRYRASITSHSSPVRSSSARFSVPPRETSARQPQQENATLSPSRTARLTDLSRARRLRTAPAPAVDDGRHPIAELIAEPRRAAIAGPGVIGGVLIRHGDGRGLRRGRHDRPRPPFSDHQAHDDENRCVPHDQGCGPQEMSQRSEISQPGCLCMRRGRPSKGSAVRVSTLGRAERRDHRRERPAPPQNSK